MRADRLLSLLMLLQSRGKLTAQELSEELEVSERTVYRDVEALSASGVPVYAQRGPGGGCALLESYRTNLTGLTADEVRALFMLSIPAPLAQLGVGGELKAALLKLSASLPATRRSEEEHTRQRIYLDSSWWFQSEEPVPCLQTLQQAVWQDRQCSITYRSDFGAEVEQVVHPYGLVAKASIWYLVYGWQGICRVLRISRIYTAHLLPETFFRPPDFNLPDFWGAWSEDFESSRTYFPVVARVSPELSAEITRLFGERAGEILAQAPPPDTDGWRRLTFPFENFVAARERILGFGRAVEVLEPEVLRLSVIDFATQILAFYQQKKRPA